MIDCFSYTEFFGLPLPGLSMLKSVLCALMLVAIWPACAADAVTDAMQQAYAPYRVALFKTNMRDRAESQQALTKAQQAWRRLTARFGAKPPAPYDRDSAFAGASAEVDLTYAQAAQEIAKNQLGAMKRWSGCATYWRRCASAIR